MRAFALDIGALSEMPPVVGRLSRLVDHSSARESQHLRCRREVVWNTAGSEATAGTARPPLVEQGSCRHHGTTGPDRSADSFARFDALH